MSTDKKEQVQKKRLTLEERKAEILRKKEDAQKRAKQLQAQLSALDKRETAKNKKERAHGLIVLAAMLMADAKTEKLTRDSLMKRLVNFSDKDKAAAAPLIKELVEADKEERAKKQEVKSGELPLQQKQ